jgi:hypothetical protein
MSENNDKNTETTDKNTEKPDNTETEKDGDKCPHCGKMFQRLDLHKCPKKPKYDGTDPVELAIEKIEWRHCKGEPNYTVEKGDNITKFILNDENCRYSDFAHDVQTALNITRKPVRQSAADRTVELIG